MEEDTYQGKILLSSGRLMDPNFVKTVVLIVRHDEDGAFGLVLNRPLDITVRDACVSALEGDCAVDAKVFQGGPCEGPLMVLHTHEPQGEIEVTRGVYYTAVKDQIEWLMENNHEFIRYFAGYSGWGPGQLEAEMETGSWVAVPAARDLVFEPNVDKQWSKLMSVVMGRISPQILPEDPNVN